MLMTVVTLVAVACLWALYSWRWGIAAAILVGLIQDPVRKMLPGAPAYMVLMSVPVWVAAMVSALIRHHLKIRTFLGCFPRLAFWLQAFAAYLIIPAALSASYGRNSWQITLLGAFVYAEAFFVLVAGWQYPGARHVPHQLLVFYAALAGVLLLGGPLEYLGWGGGHPAIGTTVLGHIWVTYRTGAPIYMISGFFRSPDIMGWHATFVFMIAAIMAHRSKGIGRAVWIALATWAVLNVWLCGRRKMMAMLPIFMGCYFMLIFRFRNVRQVASIGATVLMIIGLGWYVISSYYRDAEVEAFYLTTITDVEDRVQSQGMRDVMNTIYQAGFWGYGLGMSQQGVHNIEADKPRLWQESGPGKLVAELGVPGSVLFLILGGVLLMTFYHVVQLSVPHGALNITSGIMAILIANLTSAVISAQIFGDPLILFLSAFLVGLLLSSARITSASAPHPDEKGWPEQAEAPA